MGAFDPHHENVGVLLPMEGANNSTAFVDYSPAPKQVIPYGNCKISTDQSKWGYGSGYFGGAGAYLKLPASSVNFSVNTGDFIVEARVYLLGYNNQGFFQQSNNVNGLSEDYLNNTLAVGVSSSHKFSIYAANQVFNSTYSVELNTWINFRLRRVNEVTSLYVDDEDPIISVPDTTNYTGTYLAIGCWYNTTYGHYGYMQDFRWTKGVAREATQKPGRLVVPTFPDDRPNTIISGNCVISGNGGAQQVAIHDSSNRQLVAIATPDSTTGDWSASVPPGDYTISYFASGCQPITHGPYTVAPP